MVVRLRHPRAVYPSTARPSLGLFSNAENLESLTPEFFGILTRRPSLCMQVHHHHRIKLFGVPMKWRTEIKQWEPGANLSTSSYPVPTDFGTISTLSEAVDGGTKMVDRVDYALTLGFLGRIAHVLFVKRTLARIFRYRYEAVDSIFSK